MGGAALAAWFLRAVVHVSASYGSNYPAPSYASADAFWMETILTLGLVSVILGTASGGQNLGVFGALGVGGYIALAGLWGSPISGTSMNPARTFGPDVVSADFGAYWVYLAGPLLGAVIAVGIHLPPSRPWRWPGRFRSRTGRIVHRGRTSRPAVNELSAGLPPRHAVELYRNVRYFGGNTRRLPRDTAATAEEVKRASVSRVRSIDHACCSATPAWMLCTNLLNAQQCPCFVLGAARRSSMADHRRRPSSRGRSESGSRSGRPATPPTPRPRQAVAAPRPGVGRGFHQSRDETASLMLTRPRSKSTCSTRSAASSDQRRPQ
jgi:hypothetical protein